MNYTSVLTKGSTAYAGKTLYSTNYNLTIIIVTYNAASTLQKCLDSIYSQTYSDTELIVIDGNSNDGTQQILQANNDYINYWKSEPDNGIYDAMNKALKRAKGNWIYFLGADDELLPSFSDMAYKLKSPNSIYYGSVLTRGKRSAKRVSAYYLAKKGIIQQSIIYPKAAFQKYGYDAKYGSSADYAFNMQCFGDKILKFEYMDHILASFNDTGISGQSCDIIFEKDKSALIFKNFGLIIWLRYIIRKKIKGRY